MDKELWGGTMYLNVKNLAFTIFLEKPTVRYTFSAYKSLLQLDVFLNSTIITRNHVLSFSIHIYNDNNRAYVCLWWNIYERNVPTQWGIGRE
jgi:hypothetical protein